MHDKASGTESAGPCSMVIFGAAGDLTKRLVIPALYNLACSKLLPDEFSIIGFDRADLNDQQWRDRLAEMTKEFVKAGEDEKLPFNQEVWDWLASRMSYLKGDLNDPASYQALKSKLEGTDSEFKTCSNYLFYLAVAGRFFAPVVSRLGESGLACESN